METLSRKLAAVAPVVGCSSDGRIDYSPGPTEEQANAAESIMAEWLADPAAFETKYGDPAALGYPTDKGFTMAITDNAVQLFTGLGSTIMLRLTAFDLAGDAAGKTAYLASTRQIADQGNQLHELSIADLIPLLLGYSAKVDEVWRWRADQEGIQ